MSIGQKPRMRASVPLTTAMVVIAIALVAVFAVSVVRMNEGCSSIDTGCEVAP